MEKAIGTRVMIREVATKKVKAIVTLDSSKKEEMYDTEHTVLSLGAECPKDEVKVGDKVVLSKFAQPQAIKIVEQKDDVINTDIIFFYSDIVAIK